MANEDLKRFVAQVTGDDHLRIEDDLGDGYVRLLSAEAERRQAKHDIRGTEDIVIEMLRNSRDAGARNIFVAVSRDGSLRRLTMIDDGAGIPENLTNRVFEARVTNKLDSMHIDTWGVHGRGMALYAVKVNSQEAYVAATSRQGGTSFVVVTDTTKLPEKSDQSAMPVFSVSDAGTVVVRGPRNINRTVAEFAYVDRDKCSVYLGTPVEIAATLWQFALSGTSSSTRAFCHDPLDLAVCKRLAIAATPEQFAQIAADVGLDISERSARRILDGDIKALDDIADGINPYESGSRPRKKKGTALGVENPAARIVGKGDKRSLHIDKEDVDAFKDQVLEAFQPLAQAYYLEQDADVDVTVRGDELRVAIKVRKLD